MKTPLPIYDDKSCSTVAGTEGHLHRQKFMHCFQADKGEQRTLPEPINSQLPSAQNNHYTNNPYDTF